MKKVLISIIVIFGLFLGYLVFYGLLEDIVITEKKTGPFVLIYEKHTGPYTETGAIQNKIYEKLLNLGVETTRGFGIYYDNPEKVDKSKLRSIAGCVLNREDKDKLSEIKKTMKVKEMPLADSVYTEFPYKGMMSVILGINRVYPKINKYMEDKKIPSSPVMELYDIPAGKIMYIVPLSLKKEFLEKLIAD